ncbi:ABC transporter permease [Chitinophaga japonensis]|uniref:Putative ABC transport system permease protein n=1 Tax=Chitinophaga japonensis TaxID=104662 RepID=A0A562T0K3_CHIJA|nr:FtsX-like permease family protein [Chitinophaga japonensis]TWI87002.1 putative ABC transport system permease protein [Chitinophaga japonensis]
MLNNYFKVAWRNLSKQKLYSSIKIGGFALGIAACLLIALDIRHELSYDLHYPQAARIYRAVIDWNMPNARNAYFPAPFASALKNDLPEVEKAGRFLYSELFGAGNSQVRRSDQAQNAYEDGIIFADQELLDILQVPFIYGDPAHALSQPNTIVITKRKADKYFPHENPVGKTLIINDNKDKPYEIGGVIADFPVTSHLQCDFLLTLKGVELWPGEQTYWLANNYQTYFLLRPGTDVAKLRTKLSAIREKYLLTSAQQTNNAKIIEMFEKVSFDVQALKDIHLKSEGINDGLSHGDIRLVWLFGAIAGFILIIACINFINLSTARSAGRAKEVGLRKTVGADRGSLIRQFLSESLLFSFLSFALGLLLAWLLLPYFNALSGKSLSLPWNAWWLAPLLIVAVIAVGLLAGLYPSLHLSSFQPIHVLKGNISQGNRRSRLRSVLVVFQFTTSIALIIGTFIIYRQMRYILDKKVGFEKEQVLLIQGTNTMGDRVPAFKKALLQVPGVKNATVSDYLPVAGTKRDDNLFSEEGKTAERSLVSGQIWEVDHDYIKTMGMHIVTGRDFSMNMPTDSQSVIINQTMARQLGLKDPIGKRITNTNSFWTVIGVVEDFNFESLRENIRPLCLVIGRGSSIVSVKVSTADMRGLIPSITAVWKDFSPHQPIRYTFLDQRFARMYTDVQRTGRIFSSFAVLAIIVACLGLLGLSAFIAEKRTKEIGVRKVLGASVSNVVVLLSKDFLKLVVIAMVIASPLAWYAMQLWLENFAYHINVEWWVFILAGSIAVTIALLTVSFQSVKAALMNPVQSLRTE